jgi:hypothetical protein
MPFEEVELVHDYARTVSGEAIDALGQLKVVGRETPLGMRRDRHLHGVPRDRKVGMVSHLLRGPDDRFREINGADEVVSLEVLADSVTHPLPAFEVREAAFDL